VTKRSTEPTTSVDTSVSSNFAIMQIPEMIDQAKSDIGVLASLGSPTTSYVLAYATTFFTCPGRWFEIVLPVTNNIAAVVLTILDATEEINYLTHFTAWSGNKFRVYQYDYPGSKSMKVQALIFVDE